MTQRKCDVFLNGITSITMTDEEREGETGPLARKHASCMGRELEWAGRVFLARAMRRGDITQPAPQTTDPAAYLLSVGENCE